MNSQTLERLAATPDFLEHAARCLPEAHAQEPGPDGGFSFHEQVWHLADLEARGYGERIRRILAEDRPALSDFDGAREAREGRYHERSLEAGLAAFRAARARNLVVLRALSPELGDRRATQEGVGELGLADIVRMMTEHDDSHRQEIQELLRPESASTRNVAGPLARAMVLLLAVPFLGCPYDATFPLGAVLDAPRDARILGGWRCISGSDDKAVTLAITPLDDHQYQVVLKAPDEAPDTFRGHLSSTKSVFSFQELKDGKLPQPPKWNFARYSTPTADTIVWEMAEDEPLKGVEATAEALRAAFEGPRRDAIFRTLCACARITGPDDKKK
jgi:hypothetical protein